ncbi:MAG: hypothetical protein O2995_15525 [Proteobacteria bacterium]|nr:hypothetical protein [Pseudomonadota bacterium]
MSARQNLMHSGGDMVSEDQFMTVKFPRTSLIATTVVLGLTILSGGHTAFAQSNMASEPISATSQRATAVADVAWSFADGMGSTLTETATGTWQSIDSYSTSLRQSVSKTWDENIAPTISQATQTVSFTAEDAGDGISSPSVTDALGNGWRYIKDLFNRTTEVAAPSNSADWLAELNDRQTGFWTLLGDAGYKLKEIDTTIGLIPEVKFKYAYGRELSEADKAWLERKLDVLAREESGPIPALRRAIIHGILEGNETDGFFIDTVKISLLPLPKAEFSLSPTNAPLPGDLDKIYRAVISKQQRARRD